MSDIPYDPLHLAVLSDSIYVILLKDANQKLTLLADPGSRKPWSSKNKKLADYHAAQCDGEARTWREAFGLLLKEHPGFESELYERIANARQDYTKTILDKNNPHLNPNGTPRKFRR